MRLIIVLPRPVREVAALEIDRPVMTADLREVTFIKGQDQRFQELGNLVGGLIGKIRGKGEAEGRSLVQGCGSMFFRS